MNTEQTLVIFKPDAVGRGLIGEILTRLEKAGFTLQGAKLVNPDKDLLYKHYEGIGKLGSRKGEDILNNVIEMMQQNPILACVFDGVNAVENIRKLVGPTEPKSAPAGTIRGDYAQISYQYADANDANINNLIHASADAEEAEQEIKVRFTDAELHSYETVHSVFMK